MFVCLCHGVTERQILECARDGVRCMEELACRTGVGTGCGCCRDFAARLLESRVEVPPAVAPA